MHVPEGLKRGFITLTTGVQGCYMVAVSPCWSRNLDTQRRVCELQTEI